MKPPRSLRSPRKILLALLLLASAHACKRAGTEDYDPAGRVPPRITFVVPTPPPVEIFWVDTAGNLGLRGVDAVFQGAPPAEAKISDACRASATQNGAGTLTVCFSPAVGVFLKGLEWTSPPSEKP